MLLDASAESTTNLVDATLLQTGRNASLVRTSMFEEILPDWGGFDQIQVTGSTQDFKPHAQVQKTLPISRENNAIVAFKLLESWTGRVDEVDNENGTFSAQVSSEQQSGILETAQFTLEEISEDDVDLVRPGAIFYWSIGYQVDKFGRRSTQSSLRFKRGKFWTRKEQDQIAQNPIVDLEWLKSDLACDKNDAA